MSGGVGRNGRLLPRIVGKVHPLGRLGVTPGGARGAVPGLAAGRSGGFRCSPTRTTGGFGFVLVVVVMVPMAFLLLTGAGVFVNAARQLVSHRLTRKISIVCSVDLSASAIWWYACGYSNMCRPYLMPCLVLRRAVASHFSAYNCFSGY